jgi:hypothetical protein
MAGMPIDWHLRDYGCYTGYSVHGNGVLWTSLKAEQGNSWLRPTLGIDPVTGHAIDVASSKLTYTYHAHEQYHDPRLLDALPRIARMLKDQFGGRLRDCLGLAREATGSVATPRAAFGPNCESNTAGPITGAAQRQKAAATDDPADASPPPATGRTLLAAGERGAAGARRNQPVRHDDGGGRPPEDLEALRRRMGILLPSSPEATPEEPLPPPAPPPPPLAPRPRRGSPTPPRAGSESGAVVKPRPGAPVQYTLPARLGPLHVFPRGTHALVLPNQHAKFIGQAFTTHLNSMARFWATGALLESGRAVIVTPEPATPVMRAVVGWMDPLLPATVAVHPVADGRVVYMPHSHYVTPASYEHPDPCARKFLREFLLPRAIAAVRADPTFKWGDGATRHDPAIPDAEWVRSLPAKLAVLKSKGQSREPARVFDTPPESLELFRRSGYTLVADTASLIHRFVLVNAAELLAVTYGSLLTMMTQLHCREHEATNDYRFRVIALAQQGYHGEEFLFAPVYMREAREDGTRVVFANHSLINAPGVWIKHVRLMGKTLRGVLTPRHLEFSRADCRLHPLPSEAADRPCTPAPTEATAPPANCTHTGTAATTYHARNPLGDKRKYTFPASFKDIPGIGACFSGGALWRDWGPRGVWLPTLTE